MPTQVEYLHICDYAFAAQAGKPCIIGIFDNITGGQFPLVHAQMCIAVQFRDVPHAVIPIRIELGRPNGDVIAQMEGQATVGAEGGTFIGLNLLNIAFPEAGRYTVKVICRGETLATQSIRLIRQGQPAMAH